MMFNGLYVLWEDPLVLSGLYGPELYAALRFPKPADIIVHPTWQIRWRAMPSLLAYAMRARLTGKHAHFMACSAESDRLLRAFALPGELISISAYVNEHAFHVTGERKEFDAVYASRMAAYKRLHLAADVKSLFVQTYGDVRTASGEYDLHRFEPRVRHCAFNKKWVSPADIISIFNRSRVGLALSAQEGAMLASVEYMLCGLPLVSTHCTGGRERFFDTRYVRVVEPAPQAVAAGVAELVAARIDPELVRNETLAKLQPYRQRLAEYVARIIARRRGHGPTAAQVRDHIFPPGTGIWERYVHHTAYGTRGLR